MDTLTSPGLNPNVMAAVIARECLLANGENVRGLSKNRIIQQGLQQRAASTGDFPYLLANTANKTLTN